MCDFPSYRMRDVESMIAMAISRVADAVIKATCQIRGSVAKLASHDKRSESALRHPQGNRIMIPLNLQGNRIMIPLNLRRWAA